MIFQLSGGGARAEVKEHDVRLLEGLFAGHEITMTHGRSSIGLESVRIDDSE